MKTAFDQEGRLTLEFKPAPASMSSATFGGFTSRRGCLELRDFYAEFFRAFYEMLPGESIRPLRGELVIKRHGIVIVEQDEMVADRQFKPLFDDESVFDGTGNRTNVHHFIGIEQVCGFNCIHIVFFVPARIASICQRSFDPSQQTGGFLELGSIRSPLPVKPYKLGLGEREQGFEKGSFV
jgi:hypothetical protein